MENQFYVGQRVRGKQGQVIIVLDPDYSETTFKGIVIDGPIEGQPIGYISSRWANECFVDFPLGSPCVVLTEWQRKQLMKCSWLTNKFMMDDIKSILSQPEPPKYQPNQGEAVIFRDRKDCPWSASVATGIGCRIYYYGDTLDAFEVRPFDPALVGRVTND